MSVNYGLLPTDYDEAKKKLQKQKSYLESQSFISGNGTQKTLLDVSFSANLSKRYYPRILNKVNTFVTYSESQDLVPLFLTVTLDGFFRDLMRGDSSKYDKIKESYEQHIPNNDRNGMYRDYIDNGHSLNPHDLYKILSHQMHRFTRSSVLQKIRKRGDDYTMIRVAEPHKKDGVPHFHVLMYVPREDIPDVYKAFIKFFPAPRNRKVMTPRDGGRHGEEIYPNSGLYETVGFQTVIRSAAGYILKYILKSFRNMIEGKELDYLQAWYIHHKIPRIITTHTLVSQDVYYHASLLDDDWYYLSHIKRYTEGYERNKALDSFTFQDGDRILSYDNGKYKITHNGHIIKEFGFAKYTKMRFSTTSFILTHNPIRESFLNSGYWKLTPRAKYKYRIYVKDKLKVAYKHPFNTEVYFTLHSFSMVPQSDFSFFFISPQNWRLHYAISLKKDPFIPLELPDTNFKVINRATGEVGFRHDFLSPTKLTDMQLFDFFYDFDFDKHTPMEFAYLKRIMMEKGLLSYEDINLNDFVGFEVINSYDLYTREPVWSTEYYSKKGF